jgi:hypothetical protein
VGTLDETVAGDQFRAENFSHAKALEPPDSPDNVQNRVHSAHFMEMDVFHGASVDVGFGLGQPLEDPHGLEDHRPGEGRIREDSADVTQVPSGMVMLPRRAFRLEADMEVGAPQAPSPHGLGGHIVPVQTKPPEFRPKLVETQAKID